MKYASCYDEQERKNRFNFKPIDAAFSWLIQWVGCCSTFYHFDSRLSRSTKMRNGSVCQLPKFVIYFRARTSMDLNSLALFEINPYFGEHSYFAIIFWWLLHFYKSVENLNFSCTKQLSKNCASKIKNIEKLSVSRKTMK